MNKDSKVILWALGAMFGLSITFAGFLGKQIWFLNTRVTSIEGSRFTSADGANMAKEMSALAQRIAAMPLQAPPDWFLERVKRLELKQEEILKELNLIGRKVDKAHP